MTIPERYLIPYIIVNLISIILFAITIKSYKKAMKVFGVLFLVSALYNTYKVFTKPIVFVNLFGRMTPFSGIRDFIFGDFRDHIILYIVLMSIYQLLISWCLFKETKLLKYGIFGGIIFLLAVSPLGVGSAFPSSLLMALSMYLIHLKIVKRAKEKIHGRVL